MEGLTSAAIPPLGPDDHVRGEGEEGLIAYADLGCPHCAGAWGRLRERPGRLVFRHFPVASKHPRSPALHAAALRRRTECHKLNSPSAPAPLVRSRTVAPELSAHAAAPTVDVP